MLKGVVAPFIAILVAIVILATILSRVIAKRIVEPINDLDLDDSVKEHVGISKILIGLCTAFCAGASGQEKSRGSENRTEFFYDIIFFTFHNTNNLVVDDFLSCIYITCSIT